VIIRNSFINIKFNIAFKSKKEVGMKKILVIMLALFLAVPAISYAGSVTSRWDVTIGGYLMFETGYNTQGIGSSTHNAVRSGYLGSQNQFDETGNFFMSAGQTELNFLIKGPDAWGAKTMAFLSGDFTGQWSGTNHGTFDMKFAFIKMNWPTSSLTIGQVPAVTANLPTWSGNVLNFSSTTPFNKGTPNTQQIMFKQNFAKNWFFDIGVQTAGMNGAGVGGTQNNNWSNSGMPQLAGDIGWNTDSCGKVGPWNMLFSLGGFVGQSKEQYISQVAAAGAPQKWNSKNVTAWLVEFKSTIPIIPMKKENKAGAFLASFNAFTSQNADSQLNFVPATGALAYTYGNARNPSDATAPVISGGLAHLQYYLTNQVFVNGFYGYYRQNWSNAQGGQLAGTNGRMMNNQQIIANIMYDVNPAIRMGFEYTNTYTRYAGLQEITAGTGQYYDSKGTNHSFRIGAIYFF